MARKNTIAQEAVAQEAVAQEAVAPVRRNAHGIGKAWQGNTSTSRMTTEELVEYRAYLEGLEKPNARQQRHLARCIKRLTIAPGVEVTA